MISFAVLAELAEAHADGQEVVLWCPQHALTPEQSSELDGFHIAKLADVDPGLFAALANCPADIGQLENLADELCQILPVVDRVVLPIGSPLFQAILATKLVGWGGLVGFAHSVRESMDQTQPDGSVRKMAVFRHVKFLWRRF